MDTSDDKAGNAKVKAVTKAGPSKSRKRAAPADATQDSGKGGTPAKKAKAVMKRSAIGAGPDNGKNGSESEFGSETPPKVQAKSRSLAKSRAKLDTIEDAAVYTETEDATTKQEAIEED